MVPNGAEWLEELTMQSRGPVPPLSEPRPPARPPARTKEPIGAQHQSQPKPSAQPQPSRSFLFEPQPPQQDASAQDLETRHEQRAVQGQVRGLP